MARIGLKKPLKRERTTSRCLSNETFGMGTWCGKGVKIAKMAQTIDGQGLDENFIQIKFPVSEMGVFVRLIREKKKDSDG